MAIFLRDLALLPPLVARVVGMFVANDRRMRALAPRQIDDTAAINQLGVRLDAYARIEVPTVLLGGDRSPAHLGERLDALAGALPYAERWCCTARATTPTWAPPTSSPTSSRASPTRCCASTKYLRFVRLTVSVRSGSAACTGSRT
jgi:pimeloyl-ACP methyl ester carboxylesterase